MFMNITEDEAVYILAAISRVTSHPGGRYRVDLMEKIGGNLLVGELHECEKLYQEMKFSPYGDTSHNFVELFHRP